MTSYTPVDEHTKYSEDVLLSAAKKAAEQLQLHVMSGEGSATFDTREKEIAISSIPRLSYKYSFHVETTKGELIIQATCTENSSTAESEFKDCGDDDRPKRVVEQLAELRKRTLELAKKEQTRAPDFSGFGEPGSDDSKDSAKEDDKSDKSDKVDSKSKKVDTKAAANFGSTERASKKDGDGDEDSSKTSKDDGSNSKDDSSKSKDDSSKSKDDSSKSKAKPSAKKK